MFLALFFLLCSQLKADAPIIEHTIVDDGWVEVPLDFTFPYWGNTYTTSFMFANGVVGFISPNDIPGTGIVNDGLCCQGYDLENVAYADMNYGGSYGGVRFDFTIMPWHTDLIDTGPGHFYTQGDTTFQKYMWEAVDEYYQTARENTFDLTIYPLGNIKFNYEEVDIANHSVTVAVIGDLSEGEYIQWFYNHPTTNGAIFWDTEESEPIDIGAGASICDVAPLSSLVCNYYPAAYAEAYYEEQCTTNSLYDTGCSGYWEAYTNQQCSLDSLWSTICPNYETAYLDDQCETDPLYSVYCPGYALAVAEEELEQELEEEFEEEWEEFLTYEIEVMIPWDDFEIDTNFDMPVIDDYEIIDDYSEPEIEFEAVFEEVFEELEIELMEEFEEPMEEEFIEPEVEEEPEPEEEVLEEPEPEEEEPEPEPEPEPEEDEEDSEEIMLAEEEEEPEEKEVAVAEPTDEQKKKSKEKKMKEIITEKLKSLAKEVGEASTLQAQKDLQNYIIALLGYSSIFSTYGSELIDGDFYKDEEIYKNVRLPENQRGLLNGLASEILHEKMVDMQWQK